ncbi:MAG: divalent-cation tolerance protein CutA [Deltaproteobacteria bacterium]|nr:divalent-cation tolerance protein CutA [Deltaproteobacteria bacterium]
MEDHFIVVFMTAPSEEVGADIGKTLVEESLVACCNVIPQIRSIYRWEGKVCDEKEVLCLMKTRRDLFDRLEKRIKALHPYKVPEIIAVKIKDGSREYLNWIDEMVGR